MSNYQSGFTGAQIDAAIGGAVRFDVEQSKTEAQKEQAQSNIGMKNVVADVKKLKDASSIAPYFYKANTFINDSGVESEISDWGDKTGEKNEILFGISSVFF